MFFALIYCFEFYAVLAVFQLCKGEVEIIYVNCLLSFYILFDILEYFKDILQIMTRRDIMKTRLNTKLKENMNIQLIYNLTDA